MDQHEKRLNNKEKDIRRNSNLATKIKHSPRQLDTLASISTSPASTSATSLVTSTSSNSTSSTSSSASILDPPPPYVPPRAHSSNDVNVNIINSCLISQDNAPVRNSDLFIPSGTPVILSAASGSGSATPKAAPRPISSSTNGRAGTSASGVFLRKTLSSVDDIIWTDMRRRRNGRTYVEATSDGYDDTLRYEQACSDEETVNTNPDMNETYGHGDPDERLHIYTSSDNDHDRHDYSNLHPISTSLKYDTGETETETDELSRRLPTTRKIRFSQPQYMTQSTSESLLDLISGPSPISPSSPLSHYPSTPPLLVKLSKSRLTPVLFELFRLLSIVPAGLGFIWHLWCFACALRSFSGYDDTLLEGVGRDIAEFLEFKISIHTPFDHFVCLLWTLLTAHQCLALTTGLQLRWRAYYPSHATLIRLLGLQAICWPATQFTLIFVNHDVRPVVCWALIGSTTCFSRAVQIWVVSNLKVVRHGTTIPGGIAKEKAVAAGRYQDHSGQRAFSLGYDDDVNHEGAKNDSCINNYLLQHHSDNAVTIKWVARRWDWPLIMRTCVLPAAVVYFVMAWVGELRREVVGL